MNATATAQPTTSFEDRREFGLPYGPMSAGAARAFVKSGGKQASALVVTVRGEGTYVGFAPRPEFIAAWMGAENVKTVTVRVGKKA